MRMAVHRIANDNVLCADKTCVPRVLVRNAGGHFTVKHGGGVIPYSRGTVVLAIENSSTDGILIPSMMDRGWHLYDANGMSLPKTLTTVSSIGYDKHLKLDGLQKVGMILGVPEAVYASGKTVAVARYAHGDTICLSGRITVPSSAEVDMADCRQGISIELVRPVSDIFEVGDNAVLIKGNGIKRRDKEIVYHNGLVMLLNNSHSTDIKLDDFRSTAWRLRLVYDGKEKMKDLSQFASQNQDAHDGKMSLKGFSTTAFVVGLCDDVETHGNCCLRRVQVEYDDGVYRLSKSIEFDNELQTSVRRTEVNSDGESTVEVGI